MWDASANAWRPVTGGPHWAQVGASRPLPVAPEALATPLRRFGEFWLSILLVIVTLVIGYVIWAIISWTHSTTPAKQLLGMRVVDARTGLPATTGQMWMRQVVWTLVLSLGSVVTLNILRIVDALMIFSWNHQRLLDRMANTLVVRVP